MKWTFSRKQKYLYCPIKSFYLTSLDKIIFKIKNTERFFTKNQHYV